MVSYKVPATSANIGPGFDCLGMAVNIYNTISFEETDKGLEIEVIGDGSDTVPLDENNMAYETAKYFFDKVGYKFKGLKIKIHNYIPIARGLGSSSSIVIGALLCANDIAGTNMSKDEILNIANEIEGHPDNVTPALVGSITASVILGDTVEYKKIIPPDMLDTIVLIPEHEMSTNEARKILPKTYDRQDCIYNISRASLLIMAMITSDYELLSKVVDDKIHQPYRKSLIKEYDFFENIMKSNGALATFISGSGSTLMAFCHKTMSQELYEILKEECKKNNIKGTIKILSPVKEGAIKLEIGG
ncbi:homoserine kinase [Peptoanaerobacter stomatis]|uniref:Homoserine kinase n=1 Tax=Peptoanaerobacter stomatis TaxID=796937 RepID=J5U5E2_9FIRM|nr:homoserine kinase [Peptoanaerobacter stomatis]EJU19934.1 homoserine kinase [Peptoanaerobacter stomatis]NWO26123.1 homoserine kinase [Peptostreptococcaceae bacterium oral taxon 081]